MAKADLIEQRISLLPEDWQDYARNMIREWTSNMHGAFLILEWCRNMYELEELRKRLDDTELPKIKSVLAELNRLNSATMRLAQRLDIPIDAPTNGEEDFRTRFKE